MIDTLYTSKQSKNKLEQTRFGIFYPLATTATNLGGYDEVLKIIAKADKDKLDFFWTSEIKGNNLDSTYNNPSIVNAALAIATSEIEVRGESAITSNQDPLRITEEWSVIDNTSKGRIGLSIIGTDTTEAEQKKIERKIKTIRDLWQGGSLARKNGAGKEVSLKTFPKPIKKELPLWISIKDNNPNMYIMPGTVGANILIYYSGETIEELEENIKIYKRAYKNENIAEGTISLVVPAYILSKEEELKANNNKELNQYMDYIESFYKIIFNRDLEEKFKYSFYENSLIGTKKFCEELFQKISTIGVNEIVGVVAPNTNTNKTLEVLSFLKNQ
ncbi:LLM class flavin-dependent oxidoreductase [Tenacibaculum sp. M341]|uniref:LLM class flavin-dependent oxidoreductase n=1 Tax=Tenacibaculum sp. M341 TaxID=2530339 RepID=UPI001046BEA1|nr:LLM class flavin-dependent oxidoreductase [Tenacibaculum sp. M341]TCI85717.1 LLM class flavin-dependent oxidoreductase [Tenacibaculum sp. M341]